MMRQADSRLSDLLDPVRDQAVGDLLQALAAALDTDDAEVAVEPVRRSPRGKVLRQGALDLPARDDLRLVRNGRRRTRRVESAQVIQFEPLCLVADGGFTTVVTPFRWEAATLVVETRQARPDWRPMRRWLLEWVQSRFADVAPDLSGAVHSLDGPHAHPSGFRFVADLGSAPVAAFGGLIEAVAESGAIRLRIGQDE